MLPDRRVPRAELSRQPIDLPEVAGNVCPALLAGGSPRAGLVNSVGPSPHAEKTLELLEHMVHTQSDPAGQFAATGTPSPSDCYPVGPVGPYVAGGPVGPDVYNTDPDSLMHMVRISPDPDGQDAAATGTPSPSDCYPVGPVGPYVAGGPVSPDVYNTDQDSLTHTVWIPPDPDGQDAAATGAPSPSDCYPAGPAGPYVAGGPVGPDDCLSALESCEHLVPDHADPVGQHDADLDTAESLEYEVIKNILDGRPMEGITCPELLEYSLRLLDATLDGGLAERISEWKPVITPARSYTLDSRPMEGIT